MCLRYSFAVVDLGGLTGKRRFDVRSMFSVDGVNVTFACGLGFAFEAGLATAVICRATLPRGATGAAGAAAAAACAAVGP